MKPEVHNFAGFSQPVTNREDIPYIPPQEDNYFGEDMRFYTREYKLSIEDKKMLASLVSKAEFRTFEKYLDWRINACAHKMKSYLIEGEKEKAAMEAAEIDALAKITSDMQNFWNDVKNADMETALKTGGILKENSKLFGTEKFLLKIEGE